ncbi:hypothetical protein [Vulcaniibacterium tengchongense]|uniref:hypothetical protein n=1 Tax=Vulcaniibacterium tengchongense TaxID=1273429 RepID=UPI0013150940|nr:hypothetical protein [Vulcaniibacterium tengchongense]
MPPTLPASARAAGKGAGGATWASVFGAAVACAAAAPVFSAWPFAAAGEGEAEAAREGPPAAEESPGAAAGTVADAAFAGSGTAAAPDAASAGIGAGRTASVPCTGAGGCPGRPASAARRAKSTWVGDAAVFMPALTAAA